MNKTVFVSKEVNSSTLTDFQRQKGSFNDFQRQNIYKNEKNKNSYVSSFNPFITVATPLFAMVLEIQSSITHLNMDEVREDFINKLNTYSEIAIEHKIENMEILVTRYILCTFIDEILNVAFSNNNNWFNRSLLSIFHNETYGGENFFHLLNKFLKAPAKYIHILELMYICLSLGFLGKYRVINRGEIELSNIKESLYRQIKIIQGREPMKFYVKAEPFKQRYKLFNRISYPILISFICILLVSLYFLLSYRLYEKSSTFSEFVNKASEKEIQRSMEKNKR